MFKYAFVLFMAVVVCSADPGPESIVRPCRLNDYRCIADNLSANSNCDKNARGFIPHHYHIPKYKFSTPTFASSYIETNLIITNLDGCRVSEFFINKATNAVVLSLDCPYMNFDTDRKLIQHASLKEDKEFSYHFNGTYPLVRITQNLKQSNNFDICGADTYTEVTELPIFQVNPDDKKSADFLTQDLTMMWNYVIEDFHERGRHLFRDYINSEICDFGCRYHFTEEWH